MPIPFPFPYPLHSPFSLAPLPLIFHSSLLPYPPHFPSSPYILPSPTDLPNALALKGSLALSQCNLRGRCMYIYVYG